jgi:hypothetical protein
VTEARERTDRITEEATQRRRRDDNTIDGGQRLKLAIPPEVEQRLKEQRRTPRWVNDEGNRLHNLTQLDDYDRVEGVEPRVVGTTKDGQPIKAYLCSKPQAFIEEDRTKADAPRVEFEKALERGKLPNDPIAGNDSFYADPANSISRGNRNRSP